MNYLFRVNRKGYIEIKDIMSGGWQLEHRVVVEKFIGRELTSKEVVHHINEIKTDNRIDNLMVFPNNKAHAAFHNKIKKGMTRHIREQIDNRWKTFK